MPAAASAAESAAAAAADAAEAAADAVSDGLLAISSCEAVILVEGDAVVRGEPAAVGDCEGTIPPAAVNVLLPTAAAPAADGAPCWIPSPTPPPRSALAAEGENGDAATTAAAIANAELRLLSARAPPPLAAWIAGGVKKDVT
jgi:hypothetical protein